MTTTWRVILLSACAGSLWAQAPGTHVTGVVQDEQGYPVVSAEVRVDGTSHRVLTDATGTFELPDLTTDSVHLSIRRLGFRPTTITLPVTSGDSTGAKPVIHLAATAQQLAAVNVAARPEVYDARLSGFYAREKKQAGHFITRERLENLTSHRFTDLLREVPGLRLVRGSQGIATSVRLRGADCPPQVFLDGFPALAGEFDLDALEPGSLEGVEVYAGLATIPAEFLAARGGERCGVIAIWTRPYRPQTQARKRQKSGKPATIAELVSAHEVFTADRVDIPAELKTGTAMPFYPDSLLNGGISGRVLTEFVVDTTGAVELQTAAIVSSSGDLFSRSALNALAEAAFKPAVRNGVPVRQVVQLPFVFEPPPKPSP